MEHIHHLMQLVSDIYNIEFHIKKINNRFLIQSEGTGSAVAQSLGFYAKCYGT